MKKCKWLAVMLAVLCVGVLSACGSAPKGGEGWFAPGYTFDESGDSFNEITENDFILTETEAKSSFSLDANSASYSYMRAVLNDGRRVDKNAVRIEEMINYFSYDYPAPEADAAVALSANIGDCPWNDAHKLMTVGVRTQEVDMGSVRNNLVFLVDSSGSMYGDDRLGLLQNAFALLTENLTENDRISVVTYAGDARVILRGVRGDEGVRIRQAVYEIEAGGSTAGAKGIRTAYEIAAENYIAGGNNRVILATDGDFNVGVSTQAGLEKLIKEKRETGIYLSVLGFGMGNYKDDKMETLAKNGNGNYAYVDSLFTARKILVQEMGGTLVTVARDAKAQVTFDPTVVKSYRLIGYENKLLTPEQFEDDKTDAGELGAGLTVTALYEVELIGEGKAAIAAVRYKDPGTTDDTVTEVTADVATGNCDSEDFRFITAVAEFGLLLRDSVYMGNASFAAVVERLNALSSAESDVYRKDFKTLVKKAADIYNM